MAGAPNKVLIHRLGSLGDTAIMAPVFHHLNNIWPNAEKRVLTNFPVASVAAPLQAVLGDEAFVTGYFAYPVGTRCLSDIRALARDIRDWKPDVAIYANETKPVVATLRDGAFLKFAGARRIIGLPLSGTRRQHRIDEATGLFERETSRIARALEELGHIDIDNPAGWDLCLADAERAEARALMTGWPGRNRYICFSPGTKQSMKDWTDPNWIAVFERLTAAHPDLGIVVVGAPDDRDRSDQLLSRWNGPCLNTCGRAAPRVSAALMEHAVLFLGNDSGPMHLAAAVNTPAVAVFSRHARPGIWFPLGDRHRIFYPGLSWSGGIPPVERRAGAETTIASIPADQVTEACLGFLEGHEESSE